MKLKAGLKQTTLGLGSRMLQPANCSLESFKARQDCNRFRHGVPLDNCKGEERILIIISRRLQLSECHGMAVSRDTGI